MPIYVYHCPECGVVDEQFRTTSECSTIAGCSNCGAQMDRVFTPPMLLNRSKPGTFRHDRGKLNAWDDRLARLRVVEAEGPAALRKEKEMLGNVYDMTLKYRKDKYG